MIISADRRLRKAALPVPTAQVRTGMKALGEFILVKVTSMIRIRAGLSPDPTRPKVRAFAQLAAEVSQQFKAL